MADSTLTKKALSIALKRLMEEKPFAKISVGDICEKCNMNRKSFYYHFKDKYDLINWIYDTEFIAVAREMEITSSWELLQVFCQFFYDNREFYRKTLALDGQNSFSEYFREIVGDILKEHLSHTMPEDETVDFIVDFYADAVLCSIKRWLSQKDCDSAEVFTGRLRQCMLGVAGQVIQEWTDV